MYMTLKQKACMKVACRFILVLFWLLLVVSFTALLIGRAEAASFHQQPKDDAHHLFYIDDRFYNLGTFGSRSACDKAIAELKRKSRQDLVFVCLPVN